MSTALTNELSYFFFLEVSMESSSDWPGSSKEADSHMYEYDGAITSLTQFLLISALSTFLC